MDRGERFERILGLNATLAAGLRELRVLESGPGGLGALGETLSRRGAAAASLPRGLRRALRDCDLLAAGRAERRACERLGVTAHVVESEDYPPALRLLPNPPLVVFARGRLPRPEELAVTVVGSRRATRYGLRIARRLSEDLAARGVGVVSGLARGVDTAAHEGSLAGPGAPFAVLGCGLGVAYPPENADLLEEIASRGGVLSEFGPDVAPRPAHFPRRNRLLAALGLGTVVVEAAERSGALVTARWALDLGREVLAVPGQIDNPLARGTLGLLADGAVLVRGVDDVLAALGVEGEEADEAADADEASREPRKSRRLEVRLDADERRLLALLDHEPTHLDVLLASLEVSTGAALTRLMALELKGLVERGEGLTFRRIDD